MFGDPYFSDTDFSPSILCLHENEKVSRRKPIGVLGIAKGDQEDLLGDQVFREDGETVERSEWANFTSRLFLHLIPYPRNFSYDLSLSFFYETHFVNFVKFIL